MEKDHFTQQIKISAVDAKEFMLRTEYGEFTLTLVKRVRFTPADQKYGLQFFNQLEQPNFKQITGSNNFFLALTETGSLYYWGRTIYAAAGQKFNKNTPVRFNLKNNFIYISCSKHNCAAIDDGGMLHVWGYNKDNYLNLTSSRGNHQESYIYLPVPVPHKVKFSSVAVGLHHFIAISEFGNVYIWGSNREKQLGVEEPRRVFKPRQLSFPTKAKKVVCGDYHSAILLEDNNLYIIGYTDKPTKEKRDYDLRLIDHNVKDVACWNGTTVYVTAMPVAETKVPPKPNICRLVLQRCSWISFCGPEIHLGIKHFHESEFREKLQNMRQEHGYHHNQANELNKYGYTSLHHAVYLGDVSSLFPFMDDISTTDYMGLLPIDHVIQRDDLKMFQIFLQNYAERKMEVHISTASFIQVYFRSNPAISFHDILLGGSVKSLVKGIAKLLKKRTESNVIDNPNYNVLFNYLQNEEITRRCINHLINLRPLAKFLKIGKFFDWFMKMHSLSDGALSTKIFLDYLCQTIQRSDEVSDLIVRQARKFFSVHTKGTGLMDYIQLIIDEIMHISEEDTKFSIEGKRNRVTTFLAATLGSYEGRVYVLKKYTLFRFYKNLRKHPMRFALLKFFANEVEASLLIKSEDELCGHEGEILPVNFGGQECAVKKFDKESKFFKEILATSLVIHDNVIHSVGFALNPDLSASRVWASMVVLPRYEELSIISSDDIIYKIKHFRQLAEAISELHQSGIIHIDIKEENVLFDVITCQIKLIDFSTCHMKSGIDDTLTFGTGAGFTPRWAGREFEDDRPLISFGTDVFLFGTLMANFMLPTIVPRYEPKRARTFTQKQTEALERLLSPKIALHFISLIYGCINNNIRSRLSIEDVLKKLNEILKMLTEK